MMHRTRCTAARGIAAVLLVAQISASTPADASTASPVAPPSRMAGATVAKVVVRTVASSQPGAGSVVWRVPTATRWGDGPQQLLVLDEHTDSQGRRWLKARLPIRPNGTSGWVRADHVLISRTPYWLEVSRARRTVSVYRAGRLIHRFRAVVGAPTTPTPLGLHAIYDPVAQPDPNGFLGPWVIHLTAFSNVLENYGGGPGRVAIHGRSGDSLRDPLGTARSHGCIRINNDHVRWLADILSRGTPVLVTR